MYLVVDNNSNNSNSSNNNGNNSNIYCNNSNSDYDITLCCT